MQSSSGPVCSGPPSTSPVCGARPVSASQGRPSRTVNSRKNAPSGRNGRTSPPAAWSSQIRSCIPGSSRATVSGATTASREMIRHHQNRGPASPPATACSRAGQVRSRSYSRACSYHAHTTAWARVNTRPGSAPAAAAGQSTFGQARCAAATSGLARRSTAVPVPVTAGEHPPPVAGADPLPRCHVPHHHRVLSGAGGCAQPAPVRHRPVLSSRRDPPPACRCVRPSPTGAARHAGKGRLRPVAKRGQRPRQLLLVDPAQSGQ